MCSVRRHQVAQSGARDIAEDRPRTQQSAKNCDLASIPTTKPKKAVRRRTSVDQQSPLLGGTSPSWIRLILDTVTLWRERRRQFRRQHHADQRRSRLWIPVLCGLVVLAGGLLVRAGIRSADPVLDAAATPGLTPSSEQQDDLTGPASRSPGEPSRANSDRAASLARAAAGAEIAARADIDVSARAAIALREGKIDGRVLVVLASLATADLITAVDVPPRSAGPQKPRIWKWASSTSSAFSTGCDNPDQAPSRSDGGAAASPRSPIWCSSTTALNRPDYFRRSNCPISTPGGTNDSLHHTHRRRRPVVVLGTLGLGGNGVRRVRRRRLSADSLTYRPTLRKWTSTSRRSATKTNRPSFAALGTVRFSPYQPVPAGSYTIAMRLEGAPASEPPVLSTTIQLEAHTAATVVGMGKNTELALVTITDGMELPGTGKTKVRVIQAAMSVPAVDSVEVAGSEVASDLAFTEYSNYSDVDSRRYHCPGQRRFRNR